MDAAKKAADDATKMVCDEAAKVENTVSDAATTACDKVEKTTGVDTDTVEKEVEKVEKEVKEGYDTVSLLSQKPSRRVLVRRQRFGGAGRRGSARSRHGFPRATLFARCGPPLRGILNLRAASVGYLSAGPRFSGTVCFLADTATLHMTLTLTILRRRVERRTPLARRPRRRSPRSSASSQLAGALMWSSTTPSSVPPGASTTSLWGTLPVDPRLEYQAEDLHLRILFRNYSTTKTSPC